MHQRQIGPFTVSAIGLGCMNVSMGYDTPPSDDDAGDLFNRALDQGYSFLDTAAMYGMGHSESIIGRYLASRRDQYVLASKCGIFTGASGKTEINGRPEVLRRTCEESLKRLKTDVIDLYYLHRVDPDVPVEESIGVLSRLVEEGKLQTLGLSEVNSQTLRRAHSTHPITAVQSEYSLWSRTPERKMLATCSELGIAFVPFSPLARQFLTGKCPPIEAMGEDDIRVSTARPRFEPDNYVENEKLLQGFNAIAIEQNCSMAQLALAWLLAQSDTMVPIPGTRSIDHMVENAAAGDLKLNATVVAELDQLINEQTVSGRRYTDALMESIDSEQD